MDGVWEIIRIALVGAASRSELEFHDMEGPLKTPSRERSKS
jgi:hypothetical protein